MNFLTTGDMAKQLDVDRDAVSYALRKTKIKPIGRAGLIRIFQESALEEVEKFINSKEEKAGKVKCLKPSWN